MHRALETIIGDQERVFGELLLAQRDVDSLHRAGRELTPVDGGSSEIDRLLERLHSAQHRLDALSAEALEAITADH